LVLTLILVLESVLFEGLGVELAQFLLAVLRGKIVCLFWLYGAIVLLLLLGLLIYKVVMACSERIQEVAVDGAERLEALFLAANEALRGSNPTTTSTSLPVHQVLPCFPETTLILVAHHLNSITPIQSLPHQ